jgi:hypothetical protein
MRWTIIILYAVMMTMWGVNPSLAEKRVALVIGNANYQSKRVGQLPNTANDATAMAKLFRESGIDVVEMHDLSRIDMDAAIHAFMTKADDSDIAIVYYAGHGAERNGNNYLIPIDALLTSPANIAIENIALQQVLDAIAGARRLRLVILDACRDDPYAPTVVTRGTGNSAALARVVRHGLAAVSLGSTPDTLVAFAAAAGRTASDGAGPNSPYTTALLHHIATPGLEISRGLRRVRDEVLHTTADPSHPKVPPQEPYVYGSIGDDPVYLVPAATPAPAAVQASQPPQPTARGECLVIEEPHNGEVVQLHGTVRVKGTILSSTGAGEVWVVVYPLIATEPGRPKYWVQDPATILGGEAIVAATFGTPGSSSARFAVAAFAAPTNVLRTGQTLTGWPLAACRSKGIIVHR